MNHSLKPARPSFWQKWMSSKPPVNGIPPRRQQQDRELSEPDGGKIKRSAGERTRPQVGDTKYVYNDTDEHLVEQWAPNFTSRIGDGSGHHEAVYFDTLNLLIELKRNGAMLDVGGGSLARVGRLAAGRVSELVVLEPDLERYEQCRQRLHSSPATQVLNQFSSAYIAENPEKRFDLLVLGMVIQHVSTPACADLIQDVARLLKPDGVAVLSTTLVPQCAQGFSFSNDPGRAYVSRDEFNRYAEDSLHQDKGIPVRRFTEAELRDVVAPHFEVLHWSQYSYYRPEKLAWFSGILKVPAAVLRDVGNSQFVVLRPHRNAQF